MDLTTATPAQIDTAWAPISTRGAVAEAAAFNYRQSAKKSRSPQHYLEQAEKQDAIADAAVAEAAPFRAEWRRRGGWTRIFWCTANGGHAHSSLHCQTIRLTTGMVWLPEHSGATEAELVELAGESACTFCYRTAPVTAKPSQLRPAREAREEKAKRDAELAAKRAAKAEKAITNPDGTPLRGRWGSIGTVVTAWNELVELYADTELYGYTWDAERKAAADRITEALEVKLGQTREEVIATREAKVAAKIKRAR